MGKLVFRSCRKKYLEENKLPLKCLLVLDNAPAHPPGLEDDILPEFSFIKVLYLPPNTTPLLQPMGQQVISNFKKLYTKHLFKRCFEITESTNFTLSEFWKEHFDIVRCLKIIDFAWQVSRRTLNSSWKKLWPDVVHSRDFEGFAAVAEGDSETVDDPEPVEQPEVEEIVSIGTAMGLLVDEDDIDELIEEHQDELTTEDLKELEAMQLSIVQEEFSAGEQGVEEEVEETTSSAEIKDMLQSFYKLKEFIELKHPEKVYTARIMGQFQDICLSHFRNVLLSRQKQASINRYFTKRK